jgi:hypothetical protein
MSFPSTSGTTIEGWVRRWDLTNRVSGVHLLSILLTGQTNARFWMSSKSFSSFKLKKSIIKMRMLKFKRLILRMNQTGLNPLLIRPELIARYLLLRII